MEHDLKIQQPEIKAQDSNPDFQLKEDIVQRHLSDINGIITDEDTRNVKIDLSEGENNDQNLEERVQRENKEILNDDDDMSPLWNIFS